MNICTCWHGHDFSISPYAQLGHPTPIKMQQLVSSLFRLSNLSCELCHLGKQSRSSFPNRVSQCVSFLFSLVHSNISGPSHVKSNLGFQYFVTFIDDFSRCIVLFLKKHCFELFSIFQSFLMKLKINLEFEFESYIVIMPVIIFLIFLTLFMKSHGIIHQTSCACTPQQNGDVEHKNRHLVETTRTVGFLNGFGVMLFLVHVI